jgi:hypothetical protein
MATAIGLVLFGLGGCATFSSISQSTKYDPAVRSVRGTIIISDPKLYSREALIDERAREVSRISDLIASVEKVEFVPEINREIEQIRAISAALGLKFDPAAGLNYRRALETGDIQQQIDTLRLQLQLEQLRRDAELLRGRLSAQTDPVNPDLGIADAEGPSPAVSQSTTASIGQLKEQVDRLLDAMKGASEKALTEPSMTKSPTNPFDEFRDKQAYLDMLRSARNAAALDDIHDQGASLIRLNFQATVVPDSKYPRSLAAVQVKIFDQSSIDDKEIHLFLEKWLEYININDSSMTSGKFENNSAVRRLERKGLLSILDLGVREFAFPATKLPESIPNSILARNTSLGDVYQSAKWDSTDNYNSANFLVDGAPSGTKEVFRFICNGASSDGISPDDQSKFVILSREITIAMARIVTHPYAQRINSWVKIDGGSALYAKHPDEMRKEAVEFIGRMGSATRGIEECSIFVENLRKSEPRITWTGLIQKLEDTSRKSSARIYEVGPREQVQQVSTIARSAESLALAASIAASAPASGQAAEAVLGYSKQTMGRASARERVPSVVGYTVGGKETFGWVIGPRVSINPKGGIDIEQMLKPYDLTVDMSVPFWWTQMKLGITTQLGPSPHHLVDGIMQNTRKNKESGGNDEVFQTIFVPLSNKAPDFNWFTLSMMERPEIDDEKISVAGGPINACSPSTLHVVGRDVWRAEKVMVLGQILERDSITITPDMKGILLRVPKIVSLAGAPELETNLLVFTPRATYKYDDIIYTKTPSGDNCNPKKAESAADPNKIVISTIYPKDLRFVVPAAFEIVIEGKNVDRISRVTLHGQPGVLAPNGADKLTIKFTEAITQGIDSQDVVLLEFFTKNKNADEFVESRFVRTTRRERNL